MSPPRARAEAQVGGAFLPREVAVDCDADLPRLRVHDLPVGRLLQQVVEKCRGMELCLRGAMCPRRNIYDVLVDARGVSVMGRRWM
jgi:hypothetical protein